MVNRDKLKKVYEEELELFKELHPTSIARFERAKNSMLLGVPLNWMVRYAGKIPISVDDSFGAHLIDADGIEYVDFCLGDTGSMTGHGTMPTADVIAAGDAPARALSALTGLPVAMTGAERDAALPAGIENVFRLTLQKKII